MGLPGETGSDRPNGGVPDCCWPISMMRRTAFGAPGPMPPRSSRAQSPAICRSSRPASSGWRSISRPPDSWESRLPQTFWRWLTKWSN